MSGYYPGGGHAPTRIIPNPRAITVPAGPAPGAPRSISPELTDADALATYRAETRRLRDAIDAEADYLEQQCNLPHFAGRLRAILQGGPR